MEQRGWIKVATILLLTGSLVGAMWLVQLKKERATGAVKAAVTKDKYLVFAEEIFTTIKTNYWEKISDKELSEIYRLAIDKLTNKPETLKSADLAGVNERLKKVFEGMSEEKKKEFSATLGDMVLVNLKPFGRSRLYSLKEEKALSNNVSNVNPTVDHFKELGVTKEADDKQIAQAFENKVKALTPEVKTSTVAAQKLAEVKQAYSVLKNSDSRKIYEISGVEPTINYRQIGESIFYMHLTKFSPTTLEEFVRVADKTKEKPETLDTLILDLRGNIGGAIDQLPYLLGPFIGPNNYAYQFYHQGNYEDFKTLSGWLDSLVRYKKVVVLVDQNSQSTAEVMAAVLKKYNVGVIVGTTTRGWGTVEKVFQLNNQIASDEKFSVFLVHRVTVRDDSQPIEGRGVEPMISIKSPNWKKELLQRFNVPEIVTAVENIYKGNW